MDGAVSLDRLKAVLSQAEARSTRLTRLPDISSRLLLHMCQRNLRKYSWAASGFQSESSESQILIDALTGKVSTGSNASG